MKYFVCDICRKQIDDAVECKLPCWFSSFDEKTKAIVQVKYKINPVEVQICQDCSEAVANFIYDRLIAMNPTPEVTEAIAEAKKE